MIPIVAGLLMGAAMGGGIAALQGKDVLKGALMGGAGGALGGVLMPAAGGIAGAGAESPLAGSLFGEASSQAITPAFNAGIANPLLAESGASGVAGAAMEGGALGLKQGVLTSAAPAATTPGFFGGAGGIGSFLSANKGALMGGAVGGMMAPGEKPPSPDQGDIREFDFNPGERNPLFGQQGEKYYTADRGFTPGKVTPVEDYTAANGGIIALAEGGETDRYSRPMRTLDPAVAAYNAQLMERANQQYNINPRPGPNQVSGFDFKPSQPTTVATETTENKGFVPAEGSVYAGILAEKKKKEEAGLSGNAPYYNYAAGDSGGDVGANPGPDAQAEANAEADSNAGVAAGEQGSPGADGDSANGGRITQRYNMGGISSLGNYSDGGQLLKGPGDGVSDSIPARIGSRQPARLADGEFVVPARIVSEIGNGSTDAGAKRLYSMMDRVQKNRKKSIGKGKVAVDSKAHRMLPA